MKPLSVLRKIPHHKPIQVSNLDILTPENKSPQQGFIFHPSRWVPRRGAAADHAYFDKIIPLLPTTYSHTPQNPPHRRSTLRPGEPPCPNCNQPLPAPTAPNPSDPKPPKCAK